MRRDQPCVEGSNGINKKRTTGYPVVQWVRKIEILMIL